MNRIFFISIKPSLGDPSTMGIEQAYARLGANTGNMLFTSAVWSQLQYEHAESGFVFDPDYVNSEFDQVVIPAANWLYGGFDLADLADRVEKLDIPVVILGLGAQATSEDQPPEIPAGTVRLIKAISDRSNYLGMRGEFSADVVKALGIDNVEVIGCPSFYTRTFEPGSIAKRALGNILLSGTRYHFSAADDSRAGRAQRAIYRFGLREGCDINYQSERPEIDAILDTADRTFCDETFVTAAGYYGAKHGADVLAFLQQHGKAYISVPDWIRDMGNYDFYLGSRIHGAVAALTAGTPACLVTHDTRTRELADIARIPQVSLDGVKELSWAKIREIYDSLDFSEFEGAVSARFGNYVSFLDSNGLAHKLGAGAPLKATLLTA